VRIHELVLLGLQGAEASFRVRCSKGTYVRTLAEDLARSMGSCAHLTALRRTAAAPFTQGELTMLEQVERRPQDTRLLPADAALPHLDAISLDQAQARRLLQGQRVALEEGGVTPVGLLRLYAPGGRFLGIGAVEEGARELKPVRLFNDLGAIPT
jgi:tRNA pseudouridine55 synthase